MQATSKQAVLQYLQPVSFQTVLDAPSGDGWLLAVAKPGVTVDGVDLYASERPGYRHFWKFDLDNGLPEDCRGYDLICCCEGLEHVGSPLLLLRHFYDRLKPGGTLIVTTPNSWYPQSRLQYLFRGFFPSFPPLAGKVVPGTHMHITPWSYPQLYTYFRLAGFPPPQIIPEPLSRAQHVHEHLVALPARLYCRSKERKASSGEARQYWQNAGSDASLLGRHLIVVAKKPL